MRLLLAKSLYGLGLYRESLEHAKAVHDRGGDRESAKVMALDQAGLKDWAAALSTLETLMAEATEISVLNLASECHLALGHPERALPLLQNPRPRSRPAGRQGPGGGGEETHRPKDRSPHDAP